MSVCGGSVEGLGGSWAAVTSTMSSVTANAIVIH